MFGFLNIFLAVKNAAEASKEPEYKLGEFNKWLRCGSCKWTAKELYKNKTVCPECGSEDLKKTIGRWNHKIVNDGYFHCYKKVEFLPKEAE